MERCLETPHMGGEKLDREKKEERKRSQAWRGERSRDLESKGLSVFYSLE